MTSVKMKDERLTALLVRLYDCYLHPEESVSAVSSTCSNATCLGSARGVLTTHNLEPSQSQHGAAQASERYCERARQELAARTSEQEREKERQSAPTQAKVSDFRFRDFSVGTYVYVRKS